MFSHVTIGTQDLPRAVAFYDAALAPLGILRVEGRFAGWASWQRAGEAEKLWVGKPQNGEPASHGNGWMVALTAPPALRWTQLTPPRSRPVARMKARQVCVQNMPRTTMVPMCGTPRATSCIS